MNKNIGLPKRIMIKIYVKLFEEVLVLLLGEDCQIGLMLYFFEHFL